MLWQNLKRKWKEETNPLFISNITTPQAIEVFFCDKCSACFIFLLYSGTNNQINMKNRNLPLKMAAAFLLFSFGTVSAQDFKTVIKNHMDVKSNIQKADLKDFKIINEDFSRSMKAVVVKVQQSYQGIPLYNSVATAVIRDAKVNYFTDNFTKNYSKAAAPNKAAAANSIFSGVLQNLNIQDASYKLVGMKDDVQNIDHAVRNRLIYYPTQNNELRLCYEYIFEEKGTSNYWDILADAQTGEILVKENLTVSCSFNHDAYSHDYSEHIPDGFDKFEDRSEPADALAALAPDAASYRVFPFPVESPIHGSRTLETNPWLTDASPDGWHRVATTTPSVYTITRGNNVHAYEDSENNNAPGESASGGNNRVFDFPFAENQTDSNLNAAITNLFYANNKIHDIFYRLGFTETARNFQAFNYGKGGLQGDYVMAEAQDGSGTNNANFATPSDGNRPRMQMYLWTPSVLERVYYNAPQEAVGRVVQNYISTTFGPELTPTGVTADVMLSPVLDGCTALPENSLAGKIGLIARGDCEFQMKVHNAQIAGAVGAIIYNLPNSSPTSGMAGTNSAITIPSVLIENAEAEYMKSLMQTKTVNITLKYDPNLQKIKDASFDNGIIVHEYGHGISNRNTGNGFSCLSSSNSKEQMGEGWSDFFALMLTNRPGDNASVARGIGTFAASQPITGVGIRPAKYSPDFSVNPYTYGETNGMEYQNTLGQMVPHVHSIGFVWATMLWDLHWRYVEKYGYSSDVTANATNGSTRVLQLVTDGLKLQPCSPTFIDGRDAILAAEQIITGGEDKCMIWDTFAKRGLGINASAGSKTDINDQIEDYNVPAECVLANAEVSSAKAINIYPNPAKNEFYLKTNQNIAGKVGVEIYDASGKLVSSQRMAATEAVDTQKLSNGVYIVKVTGIGINYSTKLMIKK